MYASHGGKDKTVLHISSSPLGIVITVLTISYASQFKL